ncbi:nitronate monooxygenase [Sneathiella sp. HT1-7]|uniref:nitronate monooxygenase n=1 Tax=Sneathiella sp. HT1-7 TaxID=2887192 RepID=UPI001D132851|nr:nitronate monooxygenase [Sneathiella sp. HT1-7]MCC3306741.1 nitronate monooxygenase [Sneathiella sp. HT1-7]
MTNGKSAGAWAAENAGGTISGTGAAIGYDKNGREISYPFTGRSRHKRHQELIAWSIEGGILQANIAHKNAGGKGRIRINFLKMAGGAQYVMKGILAGTRLSNGRNMIHAVTMGAGLPTEMDAQNCADEAVYLDPIISGGMALKVLLNRTFRKWQGRYVDIIGAVVYEDPWLAGGHNGITSRENPDIAEDPYERVKGLRRIMNDNGMENVTIVMAGGVWYLRDWEHWLENADIGPIAFQIGTREMLAKENPATDEWKRLILSMKEGDVVLNKFSPTGFYSSAYNNGLIQKLYQRSQRQMPYAKQKDENMTAHIENTVGKPQYYVADENKRMADTWIAEGFDVVLRTPDNTLIFVTAEDAREIKQDKKDCVGCLANCKLSGWSQDPQKKYSTGKLPDPRVFCIRKRLLGAIQGQDLDKNLIFTGHNAYKSRDDPFYRDRNGAPFIPTVRQLIERLMTGN